MPSSISISQANRPLEIQTPLGENVLGLRSFVMREQLGRPFVIEAELSSEDPDIRFDDIVGHPVSIRLTPTGGQDRFFHLVVARFLMVGQVGQYYHYRATLYPWIWSLTRSTDCRMFQPKPDEANTVPDIVQKVFRDRGFKDFELGLSGTYPVRDYCIQYRESDFNFVSRLLEHEGIAYFFKHTKESSVLVLADDKSAYSPAPGFETLSYWPNESADKRDDAITSWLIEHEVQPTEYALSDYNFLTPKTNLLNLTQVSKEHGLNDRQVYDYPGAFFKAKEGETLARIRLEELQTAGSLARAESTCMALSAGNLFTFSDHPRADQNVEHLITALSLHCDAGEFSTAEGESAKFRCEFTAIPSAQTFRPARVTPKPTIHGPQPAMVVGPPDQEIYTDEHGRVKVHFFWDRDSHANEKSSCWVRVAQGWAGKKWGSIFLPRIGHEVLVEFIEGDPDRPLVTGSLFNADNKPPYDLPAEKTKTTMKSLSSPDGAGFNEFRFEDKKGSEEVFLHAEKALQITVKENYSENVGKDRTTEVVGKTTEHLKAEHHLHVVGNELAKFDADRNTTIGGNRHEKIDGADHLTLKEDRLVKIDGADNLTVGKDLAIKTTGKTTVEASDIHQKASSAFAIDGGKVHIKAGQTLILEAGVQLSLKVGGNFIDIGPAGVNIVGTLAGINSGGSAGSGGGCSPLSPAAPEPPDPPVDPKAPAEVKPGEETEFEGKATEEKSAAFSPAAMVLAQAAEDGTPFCEECAKAQAAEDAKDAEEIACIESVTLLDGAAELSGAGIQVVNLPKAATWLDATQGVTSQDRLGPKLKFKVKFSLPGAHPFKIRMRPGDDNVVVSTAEKGRNAKFKYQDQEKSYTTDGDGTKTVTEDFFVSCCGLDTFKLVAEDTTNQVELESPVVTVKRLVYYQPIVMKGSAALDFSPWSTEFGRVGIDLVGFAAAEIQAMSNIGSDAEGSTYQQKVNAAFGSSPGNAKKPHCVALGLTGYLAFKNADKPLPETAVDASGTDAAPVKVPVQVLNLVGGGLGQKSLWCGLVDGEGWFVSGQFVKTAGGTVPITEAMCTPVATSSNDKDFRWVRVDVSKLPAGGGTIKLRANVVDRWRNGLSFPGGNVICIATKVSWRDRAAAEMNQTLIHEMGHKVNMVCDGTGSLPDAPAERYVDRGHVGAHCHRGLALLDDFRTVSSGAACVMFGSSVTGRPNEFCSHCSPGVRKMDLSAGVST